ncbi:antitoxin [Nocardioides albidus]|uniref:Antitoxin n=1 Tax=Nocardioides albidus TaxID=1517589 RepID=A0A5C4VR66_9ACTN|nr:antitoxin [Nocardioides albidus]TNM38367.1 antitoxin [Nocardioides albidus]
MSDVLVRGVPADDLARIDAEAERLGLSRNAYLKRELHRIARHRTVREATLDDYRTARSAMADLADDDAMRSAWS